MPAISRESQAIIDYLESTGLPYRVTDVNGPGHDDQSWHYVKATGGVGTAVDFGGVLPGITPATLAQMAGIYRALRDVAAQLAELIHNQPGISQAVKNGRLVDGASFYGPLVWPDHRDHVHVAVPRGTFLTPRRRPAAGSGPPTVTATSYPGEDDMLIRHDVDIPALDGQGRGWVELDLAADRVVSILVNGPYPPVDGYWELPAVARQDRGGKTIVALTEGSPGEAIRLSVWSLP